MNFLTQLSADSDSALLPLPCFYMALSTPSPTGLLLRGKDGEREEDLCI